MHELSIHGGFDHASIAGAGDADGHADLLIGDSSHGRARIFSGAGGLFRLSPSLPVAASVTASRLLTLVPGAGNPDMGDVSVGSSRSFQFWYRDPGGSGGSGFDTSDAYTIVLCP